MIEFRQISDPLPPDSPFVAELVDIFREAREARLAFLNDLHTAAEDCRYFSSNVLPANSVWVAEVGGRAGGFIAFAHAWVNHLYVSPAFQGRGVGAALLDRAKEANATLELWAFQANVPAIEFYHRRGFCIVEETDGAGNEAKMPDVRMRWEQE